VAQDPGPTDKDLRIADMKACATSYPIPPGESVTLGIGRAVKRDAVVVKVTTQGGLVGYGESHHGRAHTAIAQLVNTTLRQLILGMNAADVVGCWKAIYSRQLSSHGMGAGCAMAMSGIDMALWDIRGKALNLPLWKLLGGARDRVPTYASGALMRGLSLDRVVTAAGRLKEKGFREMKTQLALPGETTPAKEVERMQRVREAIGPDIKLMCDINQRWRVEQAIDIGRRVEDAGVGLFWLEDVTTADDYPGLARVTAALSTPVAGGEYVWGIVPFRHMVEARSVDIVMIDLVRVGGITQWMKVAGMAEAFNLPVVSHLIPEVHVHLIGAIPNGLTVEYMPWLTRLFEEVPQPVNGELAMPTAPGLGLNFNRQTIDRYRVA
jgi:L-alanine-DL-glutamate epimerase-like enolase superfamily enzyme